MHGLPGVLLDPEQAERIEISGRKHSAVLVALYEDQGEPHAVFTRRRQDLRNHAGQISFPGGRRDPEDQSFAATALREAHEEIGLDPAAVQVLGALQPTPTIATDFAVYPIVARIEPGASWTPSAREVDAVLELSLRELREGFERRTLSRRGLAFRTDCYIAGDDVIWGATARMLQDLFVRLDAAGAPHAAAN